MSAALSVTENERIVEGGNNPPPFEAHKVNIDDLREEAKVWLDGKAIETPEEAEALNTLLDMARKAGKAADDQRTIEKKPHLDAGKAVDKQWKPLVDGAEMIATLCKKVLTPWNIAEAARKEAVAAAARAAAEEEQRLAREAERTAASLADAEQADQLDTSAQMASRVAKTAEKAATSGLGLRTSYRAEITDFAVAARHFWQPHHPRFVALVQQIADEQARIVKADMPGIKVHAEQKAF